MWIKENPIGSCMTAFIITDLKGNLTYVNNSFLKLWGYDSYSEVLGRPAKTFWQMGKNISDMMEELKNNGGCICDLVAKRKDGSIFDIQLSANLVKDEEGRPICMSVSCLDITKLRCLEREVVEISEREQQRIGQDLHDSLGQLLTGISFISKSLEKKLTAKVLAEADQAIKITKLVRQAIIQIRSLGKTLNPVRLEADGLMVALQELANNITRLFGISCVFKYDCPVLIDDNTIAKHIYRIVQEATNNAIRHGKAKNILIRINSLHHRIVICVEDDGLGFHPGLEHNGGMGLDIMKYRAHMIGALLSIQRNIKGGTIVICSFKHNLNNRRAKVSDGTRN